jgi:hypothetical protein
MAAKKSDDTLGNRDARHILISEAYDNLVEAKKDENIDFDIYVRAFDYYELVVKEKLAEVKDKHVTAVESANSYSREGSSAMLLASSVGIALVANAISSFTQRNALLVCAGILLLILSILFGWLQISTDKKFHIKWSKHWHWALGVLYSFKWKGINDYNGKVEARQKSIGLKESSNEVCERLQIGTIVGGFTFILLGIVDLLNVPSYIIGLF